MIQVTIWNKNSTNHNENAFVRKNGTNSFDIESDAQVMKLLSEAIKIESIERLDIEMESGTIIWVRHKNEICEQDKCDGCVSECDCYDDDGALERFKRDTQDTEDDDFYLNDPRR